MPVEKEITKEIRIVVPEGCEIDVENSTFECIRFKEKVKKDGKPRSWKEYCKQQENKSKRGWFYNDPANVIEEANWITYDGDSERWKATLPSEALVKKFLTYMQLMSLRKSWVGNWEPISDFYAIEFDTCFNAPSIYQCNNRYKALSFPDRDMATDFCKTFRELLFEAKGLY